MTPPLAIELGIRLGFYKILLGRNARHHLVKTVSFTDEKAEVERRCLMPSGAEQGLVHVFFSLHHSYPILDMRRWNFQVNIRGYSGQSLLSPSPTTNTPLDSKGEGARAQGYTVSSSQNSDLNLPSSLDISPTQNVSAPKDCSLEQ